MSRPWHPCPSPTLPRLTSIVFAVPWNKAFFRRLAALRAIERISLPKGAILVSAGGSECRAGADAAHAAHASLVHTLEPVHVFSLDALIGLLDAAEEVGIGIQRSDGTG